ncbi:hypothetical protein L198_07897 [Cryptococcus wingfieldii CBS 7118]|uniref:NmrA-like domain-containing protein n=1 Tax=Cryptococcus wingfieldii CBS 7118 TaxID=1295528 RepID=A0A1E3HS43_9TREE|nr:hypothetical protein L198_07897 [Cryptococcus wingfieldii CBS 7118]ODN79147.1 hypothetical protein L198_07897 [Cryptococcus wingfieldii CBS 7118]
MSSNNILIVGATGKQGGATVQALLSQIASLSPSLTPPTIRFTTRYPSSFAARVLASSGASSIRANLSSIDDLHSALQGIDVAFLVTDKDAGEEKEVEMGIRFVEAAKKVGVKHVVFASVADADVASTVPHFRTKYKIEQALIESGLSHTILRPVVFMENFPQTPSASQTINVSAFFSTFVPKPLALISTTDIGHFAALALLNPTSPPFKNQIIPLSSGVYSVKDWEKATEKAGRKGWFWTQGAVGKVVWLTLSVTYRRMTECELGLVPPVPRDDIT